MNLTDKPIAKKLGAAFASIVTVVAVMCVALLISVVGVRWAVAENDESVAQLKASDAALSALVERQNAVRALVANGDPSFVEKAGAEQSAYEAAIGTWE